MASFSALRTCRIYPLKIFLVLIFVKRLHRLQDHSDGGRIKSIKHSNDLIRNGICNLSDCSLVPQPIASTRTPTLRTIWILVPSDPQVLHYTHAHYTHTIAHARWWKCRRYILLKFVKPVNLIRKEKNKKKTISNKAGKSYLRIIAKKYYFVIYMWSPEKSP
jgi:hypothetical protein